MSDDEATAAVSAATAPPDKSNDKEDANNNNTSSSKSNKPILQHQSPPHQGSSFRYRYDYCHDYYYDTAAYYGNPAYYNNNNNNNNHYAPPYPPPSPYHAGALPNQNPYAAYMTHSMQFPYQTHGTIVPPARTALQRRPPPKVYRPTTEEAAEAAKAAAQAKAARVTATSTNHETSSARSNVTVNGNTNSKPKSWSRPNRRKQSLDNNNNNNNNNKKPESFSRSKMKERTEQLARDIGIHKDANGTVFSTADTNGLNPKAASFVPRLGCSSGGNGKSKEKGIGSRTPKSSKKQPFAPTTPNRLSKNNTTAATKIKKKSLKTKKKGSTQEDDAVANKQKKPVPPPPGFTPTKPTERSLTPMTSHHHHSKTPLAHSLSLVAPAPSPYLPAAPHTITPPPPLRHSASLPMGLTAAFGSPSSLLGGDWTTTNISIDISFVDDNPKIIDTSDNYKSDALVSRALESMKKEITPAVKKETAPVVKKETTPSVVGGGKKKKKRTKKSKTPTILQPQRSVAVVTPPPLPSLKSVVGNTKVARLPPRKISWAERAAGIETDPTSVTTTSAIVVEDRETQVPIPATAVDSILELSPTPLPANNPWFKVAASAVESSTRKVHAPHLPPPEMLGSTSTTTSDNENKVSNGDGDNEKKKDEDGIVKEVIHDSDNGNKDEEEEFVPRYLRASPMDVIRQRHGIVFARDPSIKY